MSSVLKSLKQDEGLLLKATQIRTQGGGKEKNYTIGYGYNIDAADDPRKDLLAAGVSEELLEGVISGSVEIDEHVADNLLTTSYHRAAEGAERVIPQYSTLPDPVKKVMIELSYQLGATGLKGFDDMRGAVASGDYKAAAKHLLNSKLARKDSTNRAQRQARELIQYSTSQENIEAQKVRKQTKALRVEELRRKNRQLLVKRASANYSAKQRVPDMAAKFKQMLSNQTKETGNESTP
jgi:hypothetical protein